ncbi:MAG: ribosome maturation factor RimM [Pseudomonadota bacterium]
MILKEPVLLATIGGAHGIKGEVRVKAFTADPHALGDYGSLFTKDGRKLKITRMRPSKAVMVVKFKGVNDRSEAEALNGTDLYVDRSALPDDTEDDEFYVTDLIGCTVVDRAGASIGSIVAVPDFGAGDLLEISGNGAQTWFLEFTRDNVPEIDLETRLVTVVLPDEVSERDNKGDSDPE